MSAHGKGATPAPREGSEWFGVTGASDETEALAVALFDARCPGIRMTDEDLHYYRAAAQRAMKAVADELDTPALTPRHEAQAPTCQKCGGEVQGWTCQECGASFRENDEGSLVFARHEAPAEGAGEARDRLIEVLKRMDDGVYASLNDQADAVISALILQPKDPAEVGAEVASAARALLDACYKADENSDLSDFVDGMLLTRLDKALRARSSAPEAREGGQPTLTVWYGEMPESNGRRNWTATIRRVNPTDKWDQGFCFARSEYPDRVRYEADRMRWIIGERAEKPDILAYDADLHSGYVEPASELQVAMGALEAVVSDCNLAASACDNEGPRKGFQHIANDATQALTTLRGLPT